MCTVVVRRLPGVGVQILALRDELVGREFDEAGAWWPEQPGAIGGRDRVAGGTWCATDVTAGVTALLLNRPEKRVADVGAPSRGILPLRALQHGGAWPDHVDTTGMASFTLVLLGPEVATVWAFDGLSLHARKIPTGTEMFTSGGLEDGRAEHFLPAFRERDFPQAWFDLLTSQQPTDHPGALLVRHEVGDHVFATVFGQLLEVSPGRLWVRQSRTPEDPTSWQEREFPDPPVISPRVHPGNP